MPSISVLILAAGASKRMGDQIKQLLPWKGATLLGHAIQQAKKISDSVVVVLGANAGIIQKEMPKDVTIVDNPKWEQGMGSSISAGVQHILKSEHKKNAVLIMLVDQPLLDAGYLSKLKSAFESRTAKIVATYYGKKLGVPAIFHESLLPELVQLSQDIGARQIIERYEAHAIGVLPEGKEIDIDTIKDYNQISDN